MRREVLPVRADDYRDVRLRLQDLPKIQGKLATHHVAAPEQGPGEVIDLSDHRGVQGLLWAVDHESSLDQLDALTVEEAQFAKPIVFFLVPPPGPHPGLHLCREHGGPPSSCLRVNLNRPRRWLSTTP